MNFSKFTEFLESIGCTNEFTQLLYFNKNQTLKDYFKSTDNEDLIINAFKWKYTNEGLKFWAVIDNKYRKILK